MSRIKLREIKGILVKIEEIAQVEGPLSPSEMESLMGDMEFCIEAGALETAMSFLRSTDTRRAGAMLQTLDSLAYTVAPLDIKSRTGMPYGAMGFGLVLDRNKSWREDEGTSQRAIQIPNETCLNFSKCLANVFQLCETSIVSFVPDILAGVEIKAVRIDWWRAMIRSLALSMIEKGRENPLSTTFVFPNLGTISLDTKIMVGVLAYEPGPNDEARLLAGGGTQIEACADSFEAIFETWLGEGKSARIRKIMPITHVAPYLEEEERSMALGTPR
jgi:hypothetical protein